MAAVSYSFTEALNWFGFTPAIASFLSTKEVVLVYLQINRQCRAAASGKNVWEMLKKRDHEEVKDLLPDAAIKSTYGIDRKTNESKIVNRRILRFNVSKFSFPLAINIDDENSITGNFQTVVLNNGTVLGNGIVINDIGMAILNALIALEWRNSLRRRNFTLGEINDVANDMLYQPESSAMKLPDYLVIWWLREFINEGLIIYSILHRPDDWNHGGDYSYRLRGPFDPLYMRQISRNYITLKGDSLAICYGQRTPSTPLRLLRPLSPPKCPIQLKFNNYTSYYTPESCAEINRLEGAYDNPH
ncbi:MAG: hypothetical protein Hyperionvirus1_54 [Hyperionvirus sp.]|uniref:Uncharacterized protein n=1 Tax=Hyperionvirus sp. TaxID=2487770 RepID=A0A3G5A5E6_9VIRU|nr:MAG: hypothetical protein Hyperionvirus1_54 [Hyperionvirus sp.]